MLHRITGRATKCGPSAISAIAGVPTHEAAAVIRRLFDRHSVNGVYTDELASTLEEFGWTPDYALRHPKYCERRYARRKRSGSAFSPEVPFDVRAVTLGTFLDPAPAGTWAISASGHFVAYADGFVADSGAWFSANPLSGSAPFPTTTASPCAASSEAVRFVRVSGNGIPCKPTTGGGLTMPQVIEVTVYAINELSDAAKEAARAWYRESCLDYEWYDFVYEDFQTICGILGVTLRHLPRAPLWRRNPRETQSCSGLDFHGARGTARAFAGSYSPCPGCCQRTIRAHAPAG